MKALLLIAHGSRRKESNEEVFLLAEKLKTTCNGQYDIFQAGFLEIAPPSIGSAIENCAKSGATNITVLPYFLNSGIHVISDIPDAVDNAKKNFPNIEIQISQHIGASELMMPLLMDAANSINLPS